MTREERAFELVKLSWKIVPPEDLWSDETRRDIAKAAVAQVDALEEALNKAQDWEPFVS